MRMLCVSLSGGKDSSCKGNHMIIMTSHSRDLPYLYAAAIASLSELCHQCSQCAPRLYHPVQLPVPSKHARPVCLLHHFAGWSRLQAGPRPQTPLARIASLPSLNTPSKGWRRALRSQ